MNKKLKKIKKKIKKLKKKKNKSKTITNNNNLLKNKENNENLKKKKPLKTNTIVLDIDLQQSSNNNNNNNIIKALDLNLNKPKRENIIITNSIKDIINFIEEDFKNFVPSIKLPHYDFNKLNRKEIKQILPSVPVVDKKKVNINQKIENIGDLLKIVDKNPLRNDIEYNINVEALHNIYFPLKKLQNMIGMNDLKVNIVEQILYFIQGFHDMGESKNEKDFMHTVIYGPPGTGKTEIAMIIGDIYSKLGVLKKQKFKKATRKDLVAGYLGQTTLKTQELIEECLDGVLFIDEAYALGNEEKKDSFSKEALDTLCECLSFYKHRLMVIIAGYEKELEKCFFSYNPGLESRFIWRFKTDDYCSEELFNILKKKIKDNNWSLDKSQNISYKWIDDKMEHFKFYGRDMETLFAKIKICHGKRVFCLDKNVKTIISLEDLDSGFKKFLQSKKKEKKHFIPTDTFNSMYV